MNFEFQTKALKGEYNYSQDAILSFSFFNAQTEKRSLFLFFEIAVKTEKKENETVFLAIIGKINIISSLLSLR